MKRLLTKLAFLWKRAINFVTNNQIRHALVKSARPKAANGFCDEDYGFGIVDAWQAHTLISELGCDNVVDNIGEMLGGCAFVEGGTKTPTSAPPPTSAPTPFDCNHEIMKLHILTDNYGSETSWTVKKSDVVIESGGGYSETTNYNEEYCLDEGDYIFEILDSFGDGICCSQGDGSYTLTVSGDILVDEGGDFGSSQEKEFTVGGSNDNCKSWCDTISIPWKSVNDSDTNKCAFTGHCDECSNCSD